MGKPIGELQGWWAASQKVLLATWPMLIALGAWQVRQTFGLAAQIQEERIEARAYTDKAVSGALAQVFLEISNLKTTIATMPAKTPPDWWELFVRTELKELDDRVKAIERKHEKTSQNRSSVEGW